MEKTNGFHNHDDENFLSRSFDYPGGLAEDYEKHYHSKPEAKRLFLLTLVELEEAIAEGNAEVAKKLCDLIVHMSHIEDHAALSESFENPNNCFKTTNLVILACKYNNVDVLTYLFDCKSTIINVLSVFTGKEILPGDEDSNCHNAIYYAIRSSNVDILETLINKWPGKFFSTHAEGLDSILSKTYHELTLKNVLLSDEMEIFIKDKLLGIRYYSNISNRDVKIKNQINNIKERIQIVAQNVKILAADKMVEVDAKFLYVVKFIANNIHVLKNQLKYTYDRLPWEEMEFFLVSFYSRHVLKSRDTCHPSMNKEKALHYLTNFTERLEKEKELIARANVANFYDMPALSRDNVVAEIIRKHPQFEELYLDHKQLRDVYSLNKISGWLKLAESVDPQLKEGRLIMTRVLQVLSEFLKNTLESPNISAVVSDVLLLAFSKNVRQILMDLRASPSFAESLCKRIDFEGKADGNFFTTVQNDVKIVSNVISNLLEYSMLQMSDSKLQRCGHFQTYIKLDATIAISDIITSKKVVVFDRIKQEINNLNENIIDKTDCESILFDRINDIIDSVISLEREGTEKLPAWNGLTTGKCFFNFVSKTMLEKNTRSTAAVKHLKEIAEIVLKIWHSVGARLNNKPLDEILKSVCFVFYAADLLIADMKWSDELIGGKSLLPVESVRPQVRADEKSAGLLEQKISQLKDIVTAISPSSDQRINLSAFKDEKLQAMVEMLVLDIMSILDNTEKVLEGNVLFLDDDTPLLTGKCLREHLIRECALVDQLLPDASVSVLLNAKKLMSKKMGKTKRKIGHFVRDDPAKLKERCNRNVDLLKVQQEMFAALKDGNLDSIQNCLVKGADLHARDENSSNALHLAARGSSVAVLQFLLAEKIDVKAKDRYGQTPLHVAAAHGRKPIVEFFVKESTAFIDEVDSNGMTPLHIAAERGKKQVVEFLLKNKANANCRDIRDFEPISLAAMQNHVDIVQMLLKEAGGLTTQADLLLSIAAERGFLALANSALAKKADFNLRDGRDLTPLHRAVMNGHVDMLNLLIANGANVNAKGFEGVTVLLTAVEFGNEKIVDILLKHGVNVNVGDAKNNRTPLQMAAGKGDEKIVQLLLAKKAIPNIAAFDGKTPMHFAAQEGHLKIVMELMKCGGSFRTKDKNNATPLEYAAKNGHKDVVNHLIGQGANENDTNSKKQTALHVAAAMGHNELIPLLLKNRAQINAPDHDGNTPLHCAAMACQKGVIELLLKNECRSIECRNKDGMTPLHVAALHGNEDALIGLIESKADVNARDCYEFRPIHIAIIRGHVGIVNILIKLKGKIDANAESYCGAPLHVAVEVGNKKIVEILLANKCSVHLKHRNQTPLVSAIRHNYKDIVEVLLRNGSNANADDGEPLIVAAGSGHLEIVQILLNYKARVSTRGPKGVTALHMAAEGGHCAVANLLINRGAKVDAKSDDNSTPLHFAARKNQCAVADLLIARKAAVNSFNDEGTPTHIATVCGYANFVQALLSRGANINLKDSEDNTTLELAVSHGQLEVLKILLGSRKVNLSHRNDRLLHIAAAEKCNFEIVKLLVEKGVEVDASDDSDVKPIHIASGKGLIDAVKLFVAKGVKINALDEDMQTPLHYASLNNHAEVAKYLIGQGAIVNAQDKDGMTPLHFAIKFNSLSVVAVLLENSADLNILDKKKRKPIDRAKKRETARILESTVKLFESVKANDCVQVESDIRLGAFVNVNNSGNGTPLHYAAWKGYESVVIILLRNKANPNALDVKRSTPLHNAAKASHLNIVKSLLAYGATYDAVSTTGNTPCKFTKDCDILSLFKLIHESFQKVGRGDQSVIEDLGRVKDMETIKAVLNAQNRKGESLIVAAVHSKFPKVDALKEILQDNVQDQIQDAFKLSSQRNHRKALAILKTIYYKRLELFGADNPATLDVEALVAKVLCEQGTYRHALNMLEGIFQKRKTILGPSDVDTLNTRSAIAVALHKMGKHQESLTMCQELYQTLKEALGPNHSETLNLQNNMASVYCKLGNYTAALNISTAIYESRKELLGIDDPSTIEAQNSIASILEAQEKYDEALKMYEAIICRLEARFGIDHPETWRTSLKVAEILVKQKKCNSALKILERTVEYQKGSLEKSHPDTLATQYAIANILFNQGKWVVAFKAYRDCQSQRKAVFGCNDQTVRDIAAQLDAITSKLKQEGNNAPMMECLLKDINTAAAKGDQQTVRHLLSIGTDANEKDIDGITPLHNAINSGHIEIVKILLENGANATHATKKGNTSLHIAALKNNKSAVELLLMKQGDGAKHAGNDFINAKTLLSGTTALHVAAKCGSLEVVEVLLKFGANYEAQNNKGEMPIDVSTNPKIDDLLKLIDDLFKYVQVANVDYLSNLRTLRYDEFLAITRARCNKGTTLLQVATANNQISIASALLKMVG